tara:strand:+ start:1214 stop:2158 length:945 start_codon:yes stop_codon:yes gene_type:complete
MNLIAVDAMGGDQAPSSVIEGVILAKESGVNCVLVGDKREIVYLINDRESIPVYDYPEVIGMDEEPTRSIRKKKKSSIIGCMNLLKNQEVSGVFSAGSTGAAMVAAITVLGKVKGISRPAIASVLPGYKKNIVLLDSGANLEVKPQHLFEFATMGSNFARDSLGVDKPRIGLLNNGEESTKGRAVEKKTYDLLSKSDLNFIGNVEGRDFSKDTADVFVTDGFTGNMILKSMEGTARLQQELIRDSLDRRLIKPVSYIVNRSLKSVNDRFNPDVQNGAFLLGVNGPVTIAHGSSSPTAIKNALIYMSKNINNPIK